MDVLGFLVAVLIAAIDPLLIAAYAAAGLWAKSVRSAAGWGLLAGAVVVVGMMALRGGMAGPRPSHLVAQLVACLIGAVGVRALKSALRKPVTA